MGISENFIKVPGWDERTPPNKITITIVINNNNNIGCSTDILKHFTDFCSYDHPTQFHWVSDGHCPYSDMGIQNMNNPVFY